MCCKDGAAPPRGDQEELSSHHLVSLCAFLRGATRAGLEWDQLPGPMCARAVVAKNLSCRPLQRTSTRMRTSSSARSMSHSSSVSFAAVRPLTLSEDVGRHAGAHPLEGQGVGPVRPSD